MNLAILIGRFPPGVVGGAEIQAQEWARRLSDRHRITVVTRRDPPNQPFRETREGFDVVRLPVSRWPLWRTWADLAGIERAVERLAPPPDLLLCFQTFVSGLAGVRLQRKRGIPAVVWIRGELEYRLTRSKRARLIGPGVWRDAAGVLVQTEEMRVALLSELDHAAPALRAVVAAKLAVVPNGIALPEGPFTLGSRVLTVGRLIESKGVDTVLEAMAGGPASLTVAGDGPERAALDAHARRLGLDVRFDGMATRERLATLYREAACVVLAARRGEGLPNVLLEAMSYARPVIATPVAGVRDLVVDGVNGLLVAPDDPPALRAALARLAGDAALAVRLGEAGRRTAAGFGWDVVRPRLEACLARWKAA